MEESQSHAALPGALNGTPIHNYITRFIVSFDALLPYAGAMNRKLASQCLAQLGNPTRLDIYRLLVRAGPDGMNIGDIQTRLGVPASTLAFHLGGLVGVGLVAQEKIGREVICRTKYRQLDAVMEFLREECCKGFDDELPAVAMRRAS